MTFPPIKTATPPAGAGGTTSLTATYLGPDTLRASESFDWCGDIGPEGAGFVGMDGMIYRIQFE